MNRWLGRVWRLALAYGSPTTDPDTGSTEARDELARTAHQLTARISEDYNRRKYNTVIAKLMEMTNALRAAIGDSDDAAVDGVRGPVVADVIERMLTMLAPICPFMTEELWSRTGRQGSVHDQSWPTVDEALLVADTVPFVVQVNGKVRGQITLPVDSPQEVVDAAARAEESVARHIEGKELRRVIFVPNKLINLVV
jgi:leucyl-tRNA synthetase